jgi:hypothetical protein
VALAEALVGHDRDIASGDEGGSGLLTAFQRTADDPGEPDVSQPLRQAPGLLPPALVEVHPRRPAGQHRSRLGGQPVADEQGEAHS